MPGLKSHPRAPSHLSKRAQREWRRIARRLTDAAILTDIDIAALEAYCHCHAQWIEANEKIQGLGAVVKTANGNLIQNPYLAVSNRMMVEMRRWMVELGMTPSSRSRVTRVAEEEGELSLAEQLFQIVNEDVQ